MSDKITNDDLDQGFNDTELADIMSEIENLEKEFVDETPTAKVEELQIDVSEVSTKKTDLQAEIDNEMESLLQGTHTVEEIVTPTIASVKTEETKLNPLEEAIEAIEHEKAKEDVFLTAATTTAEVEEVKEVTTIIEEPIVTPVAEEKVMDNVVALKNTKVETQEVKTAPVNQTQLDFSVAGQMNLKLNFTVGGQTIGLHVSETDGLVIEMMGGARFILPMGEIAAKKKAA